jgi:hypothetical protein
MSDQSRWRTPPHIRDFIANELATARDADDPWTHLERAHIASQHWAWPHTRVHTAMLATALKQRDPRGTVGQLLRIAVAAPGSLLGRYPIGNTGRATMALTQTAPIADELSDLLDATTAAPATHYIENH